MDRFLHELYASGALVGNDLMNDFLHSNGFEAYFDHAT